MFRNLNRLYVSAVSLAALIFLLIVSGAYITSGDEQSWNVPLGGHIALAIVSAVGVLALAVWLTVTPRYRGPGTAAWIALGIFGLNAWLGSRSTPMLPPALAIAHAMLAPIPLALVLAIAVMTSAQWQRGAEPAGFRDWPSLPLLATWAPPLVLLQIGLGAAYRHKATSVLPHMFGALVVTILMLVLCVTILQQFGDHSSLRAAGVAGLSIVLAQIALGITAFAMRLLDFDNSSIFVFLTVAHVTNGAATLAVSVVVALQVRRHVRQDFS